MENLKPLKDHKFLQKALSLSLIAAWPEHLMWRRFTSILQFFLCLCFIKPHWDQHVLLWVFWVFFVFLQLFKFLLIGGLLELRIFS